MNERIIDVGLLLAGALAVFWVLLTLASTVVFLGSLYAQFGVWLLGGIVTAVLGIVGIGWWEREGEPLDRALRRTATRQLERVGLIEPSTAVEGAIAYGGIHWVCTADHHGTVNFSHRSCPDCGMELVETHQSREELRGEGVTEDGPLVEGLVCRRCGFTVDVTGDELTDPAVVVERFGRHIERMSAGTGELDAWQRRASDEVENPTPRDVWDAYVDTVDSDKVARRNVSGTAERSGRVPFDSYPAFEELRRQRRRRDALVELVFSDGTGPVKALVRTSYLRRKSEYRRERDAVRRQFRSDLEAFRDQYGDALDACERARDTESRLKNTASVARTVEEAEERLSELQEIYEHGEARRRFVTGGELRTLAALTARIDSANRVVELERHLDGTDEQVDRLATPLSEGLKAAEERTYTPAAELSETAGVAAALLQTLDDAVERIRTREEWYLPDGTATAYQRDRDRAVEALLSVPTANEVFVEAERERLPKVFDSDHGPLNSDQAAAVVRDERHNLVNASAGTGKTLTLTRRVSYLVERGVPVNEILVVTFGTEAAEELRGRLRDVLSTEEALDDVVRTYHAHARDVTERAMLGNIPDDWDEARAKKSYAEGFLSGCETMRERHPRSLAAFERHHERATRADPDYVDYRRGDDSVEVFFGDQYRKLLDAARNHDFDGDQLRERTEETDTLQYHFIHAGAALLDAYRDRTQSVDEPLDYLDMVTTARRLITDHAERFEQRHEHVLVDEFQDISRDAMRFIDAIVGENGHLFAVGDDWQSIYGFRGASPEFFRSFEQRYENTGTTVLRTNYRCSGRIVDVSVGMMLESDAVGEKRVSAAGDEGRPPTLHLFEEEYDAEVPAQVVRTLRSLVSDEHDWNDAMVLSSTDAERSLTNPVRDALDDAGIPHSTDAEHPGVTVTTIHNSKGTEAPFVLLLDAYDGGWRGLPSDQRANRLLEPTTSVAVDGLEEQRRLCYVAMTRAEDEFHAFTKADRESRFLRSVSTHFERRVVPRPVATNGEGAARELTTVEGRVASLNTDGDRLFEGVLDCGEYDVQFVARTRYYPPSFEVGERYRIRGFDYEQDRNRHRIEITGDTVVEPLTDE